MFSMPGLFPVRSSPLSAAQRAALTAALQKDAGVRVAILEQVDPRLLTNA